MIADGVERTLGRLNPRGAPQHLRQRILEAVQSQLASGKPSASLWWKPVAAAAMVLIGVALNIWVAAFEQRRQDRFFPPPPTPLWLQQLAGDIAVVTDQQTATLMLQKISRQLQLQRSCRSQNVDPQAVLRRYADLVQKLVDHGRAEHEPEDSQVDRFEPGGTDRSAAGTERNLELASQLAA